MMHAFSAKMDPLTMLSSISQLTHIVLDNGKEFVAMAVGHLQQRNEHSTGVANTVLWLVHQYEAFVPRARDVTCC